MRSELELELVRMVFSEIGKSKDWVNAEYLNKKIGCASKDVQSSISALFKGGYITREKAGKNWLYRMNKELTFDQVEKIAKASLSTEDFLDLSPIPLENRQIFKYQRDAEIISLKESIDMAKQKGDMQIENLESLTVASKEALEDYIDELGKKDKKLRALRQMSQKCEKSFWDYAKNLPRN